MGVPRRSGGVTGETVSESRVKAGIGSGNSFRYVSPVRETGRRPAPLPFGRRAIASTRWRPSSQRPTRALSRCDTFNSRPSQPSRTRNESAAQRIAIANARHASSCATFVPLSRPCRRPTRNACKRDSQRRKPPQPAGITRLQVLDPRSNYTLVRSMVAMVNRLRCACKSLQELANPCARATGSPGLQAPAGVAVEACKITCSENAL